MKNKKQKLTREQWLHKMADILKRTVFKAAGYKFDSVRYRLGCGLPHGSRAFGNSRAIGQCWSQSVSTDNTNEIFISPTVDDSLVVAHTLAHELVHAVVGVDKGHGGEFKKCANLIGLTGLMTATEPTKEFAEFLTEQIERIGDYPHQKMDVTKRKKQGTRMLKLECPCCGYVVRTTAKWADIGLPSCPAGTEMQEAGAE